MKTLPKIFLITASLFLLAGGLDLPIELVVILAVCSFAFVLDMLFFQYEKHREALWWIIDHVQLTDKPIEQSDAPESVRKLVERGGDNSNG